MIRSFVLSSFLIAWATLAHGATQVFSDGFEGATPLHTNWNPVGAGECNPGIGDQACSNVCVTTDKAHSGTHSLYYNGGSADACEHMINQNKFYLSYWMWMPLSATGQGHSFRFYTGQAWPGGGTYQFDTGISSMTGTQFVFDIDLFLAFPGVSKYNAFTVNKGEWNRIEIAFDQGTGSNGTLKAWITKGGVKTPWIRSGGGYDTGLLADGPYAFERFDVATNVNSGSYSWYADDIEIWDECPTSAGYCDVAAGDSTPPVRSAGAPIGSLASGTTQTPISLVTSESSTCRYSTAAGVPYASMTNTFATTGGTSQSTVVTGLVDGGNYAYYVRCVDAANNSNPTDYPVAFSVSNSTGDTTPPDKPTGLRVK